MPHPVVLQLLNVAALQRVQLIIDYLYVVFANVGGHGFSITMHALLGRWTNLAL